MDREFQTLTGSPRAASGFEPNGRGSGVHLGFSRLEADIAKLDQMDAEIALPKKRKNKNFTEKDKELRLRN